MQEFAANGGHNGPLEPCDVPYWRRKLLRTQHGYDEDTIREYFPLPRVLEGALAAFADLFGVRCVRRDGVAAWHTDVQFYDVFEESADGVVGAQPIAGFYLDLYSRDADKPRQRQGNVVSIRQRGGANVPLAALIFDFAVPLYGKPSLLAFADVRALFERFGHALQLLLTRVEHGDLAGMANIEWDAVGVSANVMAGLVRGDEMLARVSGHFASGERLPAELGRAIGAGDRALAGYGLAQELWVAALDVELHTQQAFWLEVVRDLWPKYQVLALDKKAAQPCSLTDIVSGSWAAAYYGHVWSRVVAADVCGAFEEARIGAEADAEVRKVGRRYRETFLALGGARHASEVFRQFRGRDPSTRALLRKLGLAEGGAAAAAAATRTGGEAGAVDETKPVTV